MLKKICLLLSFFSLILVGCSLMPNEMKQAEQIMETSPDSALHILQHMQSVQTMSDANRALYGLLYFEALDKNNKPLQPDSLISFSLNYYQNHGKKNYLAKCYYFKAKVYKSAQSFDNATNLYLKALDLIPDKKENCFLLGKIYSDIGEICILQKDYNEALKKFQQSIEYFDKAGDSFEKNYRIISLGKIYRFKKAFKKAEECCKKVLSQTSDSLLHGFAYQEIGINYYWIKQNDSAQYYLRKSLQFPYRGTNYAVRCFYLADLLYNTAQYDSAFSYAQLALKYPSTFFNQRDCYRILSNTEYHRGDFDKMGFYISKYQDCTDSVRKIEIQTKTTVLEDMYQTTQEASVTKQLLLVLAWVVPVIILVGLLIVYQLRKRNKGKEKQLEEAEVQISQKQSLLIDSLSQKIEEIRAMQAPSYKKATPAQREQMDKELYNKCLHIDDWELFRRLMNRTFNNVVDALEKICPEVTRKELVWSCLFLLNITTPDIALLLDSQTSSLYKLKQRLTQKMNLKSTRELEQVLRSLSKGK
ncbi:MAG: hypothetical protein QM800_00950 [Paludibacter sp.]